MKDSEIRAYIHSYPNNPNEIVCSTCGKVYGRHLGLSCPNLKGRFVPEIFSDKKGEDVNFAFKRSKLLKEIRHAKES